jgi:hypothetical protein
MTTYLSLANLLVNLPDILARLTMPARRGEPRGNGARDLQASQSPPRRRKLGLWAHRLRIERVHTDYLSDHLRRDIGLDLQSSSARPLPTGRAQGARQQT